MISSVMCGITWTVEPRYSPRRSLPITRRVDLAGRDVVEPRHLRRHEPLVVTEVEVGLGAVVGDEHLAVLRRVHRARIHVDVRIQLHVRDLEAAVLHQRTDRSRRPCPCRASDTTPPVTNTNFVCCAMRNPRGARDMKCARRFLPDRACEKQWPSAIAENPRRGTRDSSRCSRSAVDPVVGGAS